jgi:AcrR family transcriptional regulator
VAPRSRETNEAVRDASRARILAAARALFAERGFAACRVADIARRAGMSPGNVYWHFDSKEAILRTILSEGLGTLESMTAEVAAEYGPARRKLDILVRRMVDHHEANAEVGLILGGLTGQGGRDLVASLGIDRRAIDARVLGNLRRVFTEARAEGAVADTDPELHAALSLALLNGLPVTGRDLVPSLSGEALGDALRRLVGYRPLG